MVRRGAADHTDTVSCVSCGRRLPWKDAHAGHFIHISKQHPLSYDRRNIHPQCCACNFFGMSGGKGMAKIEYTLGLQRMYGPAIVEELKLRKTEPYYRRAEMLDLIADLQAKVAAI